MTVVEWLACSDPDLMLDYLGRQASNRKRRLFACACYRHVPRLLRDERCRHAVTVTERYADGKATKEELNKALNTARAGFLYSSPSSLPTARRAEQARRAAARAAEDGLAEREYQSDILCCL